MTEGQRSCAYEGCDRVPHKTSSDGRCIFHAKPEDKMVEDFRQALEKYLSKLKVGKKAVYDFRGFIFPDDICFMKDFGLAVFEGARFDHAIFEQDAWFQGVIFKGIAWFDHARFKGDASFDHARFKGEAFFEHTTFEEDAWFRQATFKKMTVFQHATFNGEAWFQRATFKDATVFQEAIFEGDTLFRKAIFEGDTLFNRAKFREIASISPKIVKVGISFTDATIENIVISPLHLKEGAQIDFARARLRNTNIRREDVEGHIKQEKSGDYREARDIYMLLKNNFHTIGRYDDESWAFLQEKKMERKSFWCFTKEWQVKRLGKKWKDRGLKDCFYPAIFYSGRIAKYLWYFWLPTSWKNIKELAFHKPKNILHLNPIDSLLALLICVRGEFKNLVSSITINKKEKSTRKLDLSCKEILKALLFYLLSLVCKPARKYFKSTFLKWLYEWGENPWRILGWCIFIIFAFSGLYCLFGDIAIKESIVKSYGDKLYFSGITFTTLGFGGYSPMGGAKVLAFIESFLGIFSIALFVYSFARRTAGR